MVSDRVKQIMRSKGAPYSDAELDAMPDGAGWSWIYRQDRPAKERAPEVCFTGFRAEEKSELAALATKAGYKVRKSVTARLDVLCTGDLPGAAKIEKANQVGAAIVNAPAFRRMCSDMARPPADGSPRAKAAGGGTIAAGHGDSRPVRPPTAPTNSAASGPVRVKLSERRRPAANSGCAGLVLAIATCAIAAAI